MVAPWSKETLVDGSSDEGIFVKAFLLFAFIAHLEHFLKRIPIVLQPKLVLPLDVFVRSIVVRIRLWVVDYLVFILVEGTSFFLDLAGKPIMPTRETKAWSWLVAHVVVIIDSFQCFWAQPSSLLFVHMFEGLWGVKHHSVGVEYTLQVIVDLRDSEEKPPLLCIEKIKYKGGERNSCQLGILKFWRCYHLGGKTVQHFLPSIAMTYSWSWLCLNDSKLILIMKMDLIWYRIESTLQIHSWEDVFLEISSKLFNSCDICMLNAFSYKFSMSFRRKLMFF